MTKIVLEIFVFGLTVLHFLSLPKIDWCLIRWRNRVSIYTIIFIPLYMLLLNLIRLYLTSQPTDYDACVRVNDGTVRIVPFHISCIDGTEILLLILATIPILSGIVHLAMLVKFVYTECYDNETTPIQYLKCLRMLDFPSEAENIQTLIILHHIPEKELAELQSVDSEYFKVETKSGDTLLHLAVKSQNLPVTEYLLSNTTIDVNQGMN